MQQKFFSNLILLVILNLVIKPVAIFGIDATVQNRVGSEDYGLYFSLLNFTYLFNILLDLGVNNFTTKNVAQFPGMMTKYISRIAGLRLILFFLYALFTVGIAVLIGYTSNVFPILMILIVQQFLISMIAYFRSFLSGMLLFKIDAILSVLDRFLLILLCGSLFLFSNSDQPFKIEYFIGIQFLCYFISFVVGLILIYKNIGKISIRFSKTISFIIVRQSFPYALLIILMALFTRVDSVMLERLLDDGARQAGYYAQGFRLIDAFFMFAMLFSNLLLPIFSKMIKEEHYINDLFSLSSKLLVWGAIALAVFCFFNAEMILKMVYTNDIMYSTQPFQLLVLTFIAMCVILIFGTYLTALGDMKTLNTIAFLGLLVNIGLNSYLIPTIGVVGAAISTLITQSIVAIFQVVVVVNKLKLKWNLTTILTFSLYVGIIVAGCWVMSYYHTHIIFQFAFLATMILLFRVFDLKILSSLFSEMKLNKVKST